MKVSEIDPPQIAVVTWLDATHHPGWFGDRDDLPLEPLEIKTAGWLIYNGDDVAVMAMSYNIYKVGDLLVIPAGWIKSIDVIPPDEASEALESNDVEAAWEATRRLMRR